MNSEARHPSRRAAALSGAALAGQASSRIAPAEPRFRCRRCAPGVILGGNHRWLVKMTMDGGKNWKDVSPPGLTQYSLVSMVEASPCRMQRQPMSGWMAMRQNDFRPHIYRRAIRAPLGRKQPRESPDGSFVRRCRERPARKGLLYAVRKTASTFRLTMGINWQSLQPIFQPVRFAIDGPRQRSRRVHLWPRVLGPGRCHAFAPDQ